MDILGVPDLINEPFKRERNGKHGVSWKGELVWALEVREISNKGLARQRVY